MIALVDGREELVDEVRDAPADLRSYVTEAIAELREHARLADGIAGALPPDFASQARAGSIVMPRLLGLTSS